MIAYYGIEFCFPFSVFAKEIRDGNFVLRFIWKMNDPVITCISITGDPDGAAGGAGVRLRPGRRGPGLAHCRQRGAHPQRPNFHHR